MTKNNIGRTRLNIAAWHLQNSGVIAHNTDTIIGLCALVDDEGAVNKILQLKRRSYTKGLLLLTSDIRFVLPFIADKLTPEQLLKLATPQNPPTTFLFKASVMTPRYITGNHKTVAIRVSDNYIIKTLCQKSASALVSSSANIQGHTTANNGVKLRTYFADNLDYVIVSRIKDKHNKPSIIKDFFSNKQYR